MAWGASLPLSLSPAHHHGSWLAGKVEVKDETALYEEENYGETGRAGDVTAVSHHDNQSLSPISISGVWRQFRVDLIDPLLSSEISFY